MVDNGLWIGFAEQDASFLKLAAQKLSEGPAKIHYFLPETSAGIRANDNKTLLGKSLIAMPHQFELTSRGDLQLFI